MAAQSSKLMLELEQEKLKLEGDISRLSKNKVHHTCIQYCDYCSSFSYSETRGSLYLSNQENLVSLQLIAAVSISSSFPSDLIEGSELLRIAMMLQEATVISRSLNRPFVCSLE